MKYLYVSCFLTLLVIITIVILCLMDKSKNDIKEKYEEIYRKFRRKLNTVNKKVRKNVFDTYEIDGEIKEWIIDILNKQTNHCVPKIYINTHLRRGDPNLEFNYSHTMGKYIILSDNDYNRLEQDYNINNENTITSLIVHESAHVHQRKEFEKESTDINYKNPFKELYKKWGYVFSDISHFSNILKYKRQNPDADDDDIIWSYMGKYYYINCFYDKKNVSAYNVHRYAYPIEFSRGKFMYNKGVPILLHNLKEYNDFFGDVSNNYTPNEIYADYTERLYGECVHNKTYESNEAYKIFKNNYFYK